MEFKIVAIQECSAGNSEVGDMWHETKIFSSKDEISSIFIWSKNLSGGHGGRLILTIPDGELNE